MSQNEFSSNKVLELIGITKFYGDFEALKNINLELNEGELFGFLGPNGAGKTTLICIITGILKPTFGIVKINGIDLEQEPEKAKYHFGYVPDRPYLYEKLTPVEYFKFIGGLYSINPNDAIKRGLDLLEKFSMLEWRNELIESFSHGMKQKVAVSAALIHDPKILILDEPTVGLDPKSVKILKDFLREITKKYNKTVFITTHTLSIAEDLCDRIAIINRGSIIASGSFSCLQKLANSPGSDLEAVFLRLTEE